MHVSFPVWFIWESVRSGVRSPAKSFRDGKWCLAVFNDYGVELNFRVTEGFENDVPDKREEFSPTLLRPYLNGISYGYVVVNPCSQSEAIYSASELRDYVDSLGD